MVGDRTALLGNGKVLVPWPEGHLYRIWRTGAVPGFLLPGSSQVGGLDPEWLGLVPLHVGEAGL